VITPFHFACFCEERIRAQCEILDPALGNFMRVARRFSLTEERSMLQFGAAAAAEFAPIATLVIELVPQKGELTAFNCLLEDNGAKEYKNFRLLLGAPDEAEPQILKIFSFLQKAFLPHKYIEAPPLVPAAADAEKVALETAQNLMSAAGSSTKHSPVAEALTPEAEALTRGKKYIVADETNDSGSVRMRTYDGKYVPEGELPATIKINK